MRVEELIEELEKQYPDTVMDVKDRDDLIKRQAQVEMIEHIRLIITPPKRKK